MSKGSWQHDSVSKVLAVQVCGLEFGSSETHFSNSAWGQRQVNPWDFLASQFSQNGALQAQEETCAKKTMRKTSTLALYPCMHMYRNYIHTNSSQIPKLKAVEIEAPWMHLLLSRVACLCGSQISKMILWPDSPVSLIQCIWLGPVSPITVLIKEAEIPWCTTSVCVLSLKGHHASPWQLVITGAYGLLWLLPGTTNPLRTKAKLYATRTWISTVTLVVRRDVCCCP